MSENMPIVNISRLFDCLRPTDEATSHRPNIEMQKKIQEKKNENSRKHQGVGPHPKPHVAPES